jgi:FtsP/CotA-like multicopper oxidase with cupredoxin domain
MNLDRRQLLELGGAAALAAGLPAIARGQPPEQASAHPAAPVAPTEGPAEHTIRIGTGLIELAPDITLSTKTYNGQFPGPLLRLTEGRHVVVDIHNDTDMPEQLHWHGQFLPAELDGATEEGTPLIPAHGMRRIAFTPGPAGFRFYHTHVVAGADLSIGLYGGQAGPVYIEPRREPGAYDREVFLTLKEFGPVLSRTEMALDFLAPPTQVEELRQSAQTALRASVDKGMPQGYEVAYTYFSINGRQLGHGEPVRVRAGERVLFHVLNASATENRSLALPGHDFKVVALDGNPVPRPAEVPVLWLGSAERISAIVEMKHPGIWVMGDVVDEDRARGMGIVVEYAGAAGKPRWVKPKPFRWDYRRFAKPDAHAVAPDETIEMLIAMDNAALNGFNRFAINGVAFAMDKMEPMFRLHRGKRPRLRLRNATDDVHPMHLHRTASRSPVSPDCRRPTCSRMWPCSVAIRRWSSTSPPKLGLSLFHCHRQLHMDFGLMALLDCG